MAGGVLVGFADVDQPSACLQLLVQLIDLDVRHGHGGEATHPASLPARAPRPDRPPCSRCAGPPGRRPPRTGGEPSDRLVDRRTPSAQMSVTRSSARPLHSRQRRFEPSSGGDGDVDWRRCGEAQPPRRHERCRRRATADHTQPLRRPGRPPEASSTPPSGLPPGHTSAMVGRPNRSRSAPSPPTSTTDGTASSNALATRSAIATPSTSTTALSVPILRLCPPYRTAPAASRPTSPVGVKLHEERSDRPRLARPWPPTRPIAPSPATSAGNRGRSAHSNVRSRIPASRWPAARRGPLRVVADLGSTRSARCRRGRRHPALPTRRGSGDIAGNGGQRVARRAAAWRRARLRERAARRRRRAAARWTGGRTTWRSNARRSCARG